MVRHDDFGITVMTAALIMPTRGGCRSTSASSRTSVWRRRVSAHRRGDGRDGEVPQLGQVSTGVSWSFWAYVNGYMPMTVIDPATNQVIPVVKRGLDAGLDVPSRTLRPVASFTSACTALACTFDGTSSTDPDGSITGYAWTFGDGATSTASVPSSHLRDGWGLFDDVDGDRQPRCYGRQDSS